MGVDPKLFLNILEINLKIKAKFFENVRFVDENFEEIFLDFWEKKNKKHLNKEFWLTFIILVVSNILPILMLMIQANTTKEYIYVIDIVFFACLLH